jgi:hypothetical protein
MAGQPWKFEKQRLSQLLKCGAASLSSITNTLDEASAGEFSSGVGTFMPANYAARVLLLLAPAMACVAAQPFNLTYIGSTATQVAFSYPAPAGGGYCTIKASTAFTPPNVWGPQAADVDGSIFASAQVDAKRPSTLISGNPPIRTVVVGQRTAQLNSANNLYTRHYSRALQASTTYYFQIACSAINASSSVLTAATTNIPLGNTYGEPWLSDPQHPGDQPWPESSGISNSESFIDPLTGVLLQRVSLRGNNYGIWPDSTIPFGSAYNQGQAAPCDTAGPWTSPCGVVGGSGSSTVGASTVPLVLRPPLTANTAWNAGYGSSSYNTVTTLDQFSVTLAGSVSSPGFPMLDVCLSLNGGASCTSATQKITLGAGKSTQTVNPLNTSQFGVQSWLIDPPASVLGSKTSLPWPRFNVQESAPHSGTATVQGNIVAWATGNSFSLYWMTGGNGHIRLSPNNDACITPPGNTQSTEYAISGFVDGNHLTVAGTPPTGSVYWCANNFAVMVWRDQLATDGSTVTLSSASMGALEGSAPTYPDNGMGTACLNQLVGGGFFCLYGGLYWINPTTGSTSYYGYMLASGMDSRGNYITNPWRNVNLIPAGESANIDQSQSTLTFYAVAMDPAGGGPLVIQGVFNPTTITPPLVPYGNGSEIQNASVTGTTDYSVTYSNGLTFTNLTPQVSAPQSLVNQMASFDPTFDPVKFSSGPWGWNCDPYGMSAGVFYLTCFSIGGDSPGWVLAFSPGDGNPAHAGQPGGPGIVGAVNTFNTPNGPVASTQTAFTGRSLHSVGETGETGWLQIQANGFSPVSTSSIASVPPSSSSCSSFGLSVTGDCILLNINSFTGGGGTGFEPYLPDPQYQFTGAPGELRITQIGDTACIAASTTSSCQWFDQNQELITLAMKGYNGVDSAWVFQRSSYGAEIAIPSGPVTLWWISNQSSIPADGTTENGSLAAYWNPLAGCNGVPDPHGNCLTEDTNNTSGHGQWRDGGEAVATNVPVWIQPTYGWPTDYQTIVGSVIPEGDTPSILNLPFANVTPGQAAGVSYTSTNPGFGCYPSGRTPPSTPPFYCTYGVPWGFDGGSHPNPAGANDPNNGMYAFDNIPIQGGGNDPAFTPVTGQLYVALPPGPATNPDNIIGTGSVAPINRKTVATGASCGSHPLIDLSAPNSTIASDISQSYTYCVSRVNGECQPGSSVGDIFVNCPGVVWQYCSGSGIHGGAPLGVGNDICVGNIGPSANAIRQFALAPPGGSDPYGAYTRNLVSATTRLRMVSGFENNRVLPDSSWLLFRAEWLNYQREDMWMAKLPCYPGAAGCPSDAFNRGEFIPMSINIPAHTGVETALVEFGYQEYGPPSSFNCTTRNDSCLAATSSISGPPYSSPFYFISEQPAGIACSTGCTIVIPAISQRMLFYRVAYLKGGKAFGTSGTSVVNVP